MHRLIISTVAAGTAVVGLSAAAPSPTGAQQLQATIEHQLRQTTGGVQVSDNAIAYDHGHVVEVFPDPGQDTAPRGLGSGVDTKLTTRLGLQDTAVKASASRTVHGCPKGWTEGGRWYCFYADKNFKGRRIQFNETTAGIARDYGFDNKASSWVNTNEHASNHWLAYDKVSTHGPSGHLWTMWADTSSSYVGKARNDKMSGWCMEGYCR